MARATIARVSADLPPRNANSGVLSRCLTIVVYASASAFARFSRRCFRQAFKLASCSACGAVFGGSWRIPPSRANPSSRFARCLRSASCHDQWSSILCGHMPGGRRPDVADGCGSRWRPPANTWPRPGLAKRLGLPTCCAHQSSADPRTSALDPPRLAGGRKPNAQLRLTPCSTSGIGFATSYARLSQRRGGRIGGLASRARGCRREEGDLMREGDCGAVCGQQRCMQSFRAHSHFVFTCLKPEAH